MVRVYGGETQMHGHLAGAHITRLSVFYAMNMNLQLGLLALAMALSSIDAFAYTTVGKTPSLSGLISSTALSASSYAKTKWSPNSSSSSSSSSASSYAKTKWSPNSSPSSSGRVIPGSWSSSSSSSTTSHSSSSTNNYDDVRADLKQLMDNPSSSLAFVGDIRCRHKNRWV
jgi:hypothetical protein